MNPAQLKSLAVFSLFAIIGFGPISPSCLIGMYIVTMRPAWFLALTENMYRDKALNVITYIKNSRIKAFLSLFSLFLIDIAPQCLSRQLSPLALFWSGRCGFIGWW